MKMIFYLAETEEEAFRNLQGVRELLCDLDAHGIAWVFCGSSKAAEERIEEEKKTEIMLVTNDMRSGARLAKKGYCCIGFQSPEQTGYFEGARIVLTSFQELDGAFFESVLRRFLGLPAFWIETERLIIRESCEEDFETLYAISREPESMRFTEPMGPDKELERERFRAYIRTVYEYYGFGLWTVAEKRTGTVVGRCGLSLTERMPEAEKEDAGRAEKSGVKTEDAGRAEKSGVKAEEADTSRAEKIKAKTESGEPDRAERNRAEDSTGKDRAWEGGAGKVRLELGYLIGHRYRRRGYAKEACRAVLSYAFEQLGEREVYAVIREENTASLELAQKLGFSVYRTAGNGFCELLLTCGSSGVCELLSSPGQKM